MNPTRHAIYTVISASIIGIALYMVGGVAMGIMIAKAALERAISIRTSQRVSQGA